ncbi:MAG: BMP family ABC transporter substrate-binding protein [Erysipelotrichaceae bacterium]|nr:BMP family ABC transporter substrate-binding protein [Erysipelotrichaceae bacterium]
MKRKSLFLVSVALLLCACSPSNNNPIKDKKVLVCYGNDKSDAYFGSSVDEIIKSANKEKGNSVELVSLGLGVNGANYENLLDYKINSENFDYVILLGEKANFYLQSYMKKTQGVNFVALDSKQESRYVNVANVEFSAEEVGYLTSIAMKDSENVGYLSTYDTPFDKKILYGFMQGQKDLNRSGNIVVKHFEEEENYNKTLDYTKEMFNTYNCAQTFENSADNLPTILSQGMMYDAKIISSSVDYYNDVDENEKGQIDNILIKDYKKALLTICSYIKNNTLSYYDVVELSYNDEYMTYKNKIEGVDLSNLKKFDDMNDFNALYNEMIKDTETKSSLKYSVDIPYHEAIPNCGEQNNWKYAPRYGADNGMKPKDWTAVGAWATIYAQYGFARVKNTGVEFKNMRIWGYSEKTGWKLIEWANPIGSFYDENFIDDYHKEFPNNFFNDPNTKTTRIKLDNSNIGFNYHPFSSQNDLAAIGLSDLTYIVTTMDIRLVTWDSTKPNDMSKAKYVANIGGDWWAYKGATWKPDWSANRDICVSQYRIITPNWKTLYMTNVPVSKYDEIIGNGEFLNDFQ